VAVRGRRGARRMLLQALYQWQLAGHELGELHEQFIARPAYAEIDTAYFDAQLELIVREAAALDARIAAAADRPVAQLDPVERAVLWIGVAELTGRADVPTNVTINEAVELAKEFGGSDSHRYINAILDALAAGAA
jgi:N utilization substance protein B